MRFCGLHLRVISLEIRDELTWYLQFDRIQIVHVTKWKHFPRYWPFVRGIHRSPMNSPHKGQWRRALMFSLICVWINRRVNNHEAGDLRRYRAHYDVIVMISMFQRTRVTAGADNGLMQSGNETLLENSYDLWFRNWSIRHIGFKHYFFAGDLIRAEGEQSSKDKVIRSSSEQEAEVGLDMLTIGLIVGLGFLALLLLVTVSCMVLIWRRACASSRKEDCTPIYHPVKSVPKI